MKKYGREGAYAVVTGGSDGIGLELCHQFAALGFNIYMISRNKDKCDQKLEEIKEKYPKVELRSHGCDFSKIATLADYRNVVKESGLDEIDIGIIALNAGLGSPGFVDGDLIEDQPYQDMWRVNTLHVVYLLKVLAGKLLNRDKRCAVLLTSSISAAFKMPGVAPYTATKAAVSNFGEAIHFELQKNVDVTVWEPGYIETKLVTQNPPSYMMHKVEKAVGDILCSLGKVRNTKGSLLYDMMPISLFNTSWWLAKGAAKGRKAIESASEKDQFTRQK